MVIRGKVKKGKVLLDDPKALPDGMEVEVRPVKKRQPKAKSPRPKAKTRPRSLADVFANVIGKAKGLPPDASINHDYYLYGLPKKQ
jgi:hypothetical protein